MADDWKNKLHFGDNLDIMREHITDESVDLIYLDPPFNSNATYNVLFAEKNGTQSAAQIEAFDDTWHWDMKAEGTYHDIVTNGPRKLADLIQALRSFLGQNDMMAYLVMMAARLDEMHRVLKPTGSIYLHCDPTASHYLKLLLDAVFGMNNFLNEIVWERFNFHADAKRWGKLHDTLLMFAKDRSAFNFQTQRRAYDDRYIKSHFKKDENGRLYSLDNPVGQGQGQARVFFGKALEPPLGTHWRFSQDKIDALIAENLIVMTSTGRPRIKRYLDQMPGQAIGDVWTDIPEINSQATERLGYPTQKPETLLERIIKASSNEGELILDPFCGCGTTIAVAERLNRRWIGIDITHLAITLMRHRLEDSFGVNLSPYEVIGDPKDLESARALAQDSQHEGRYQFEWWALGKIAARPAHDKKKGADAGIDGIINFFDDNSGKAKKIIVQVKSGHVTRNQIGDLKGVMGNASIGAFITLEEPTDPMNKEAASAGFYEPEHFPGLRYPRLQILTIEDLLNGKRIEYPRLAPEGTFKRAERKRKTDGSEQTQLL
jgi:site-specific DNA-methyltransferase (adenine-specific)